MRYKIKKVCKNKVDTPKTSKLKIIINKTEF